MNDTISIKMTLTKAHRLLWLLDAAAYDVKDIDSDESELLKTFAQIIKDQIARLDYDEEKAAELL